jgi:hypothetical protein
MQYYDSFWLDDGVGYSKHLDSYEYRRYDEGHYTKQAFQQSCKARQEQMHPPRSTAARVPTPASPTGGPSVHVPTPVSPWREHAACLGHTHLTELAHMRGLLDEMGRLRAHGAGAPTKLEGYAYKAAISAWNKHVSMSHGFVADTLKELLAVCGTRLQELGDQYSQQINQMQTEDRQNIVQKLRRLELAFRWGEIRLAHWVEDSLDLVPALKQLTGKRWYSDRMYTLKAMKNDDLAQKLHAYLQALDIFKKKYTDNRENPFFNVFNDAEKTEMKRKVGVLDRALDASDRQASAESKLAAYIKGNGV